MAENYRDASRRNWHRIDGEAPDINQLQFGCIQRIADAAEKMASSYTAIEAERDRYKKLYYEKVSDKAKLIKEIIGLRGQIAKQVKRARKAEGRP